MKVQLPAGVKFYTDAALVARGQAMNAAGYPVSKWITFMRELLAKGLAVGVYEAKTTRSKYVFVIYPEGTTFKVRFSNHRPNVNTQLAEDSDFYVGVSNGLTTTTHDALQAVMLRRRPPYDYPPGFTVVSPPVPPRGRPAPRSNTPPVLDFARVRVDCACGNSFNALVGTKRRCKCCGVKLLAKG